MTEENTPANREGGNDLRTVIPRLDDLKRKCRSVGSRNVEAADMEARLESIMKRLQSSESSDTTIEAEPIPYAALARELYAVERFFESNGFLSMAKEVAHVERALESFASSDEPEVAPLPIGITATASATAPEDLAADDAVEVDSEPSKWAVPKPLAAVAVFFLLAIVACIVIIVRHEIAPAKNVETTTEQPASPSAVLPPLPTSTPRAPRAAATPAPGAILAEAIGKARLALADGDIDGAIDRLSEAALVNSNDGTVLATARQIVDLLVDRANSAVDSGLWEIADLTLARANRIATRFGLDTQRIRDAVQRYSQMARFKLVKPGDTDVIRELAGRRVTIFFKDESNRESIIKGVEGPYLLLNEDTTVRGGAVYYTEKVPLADIGFLKVWDK